MIAPRRFWTEVAVDEAPDGFGLRLDARPLRTPAQAALRVPTRALAEALAAEWRAIEDVVRPEALPFTRAANVAIDRVAPAPGPVVDMLADYGGADLVCHRAAEPEALRRRQADAWDPLLYWSAEALGAPLLPVVGLMPQDQPAASLAALRAEVARHGPFGLVALHDLVTLSGSLVIGLAVALRRPRARRRLGALAHRRGLAGRAVGGGRRSRGGGGPAPRRLPARRPPARDARGPGFCALRRVNSARPPAPAANK